MKKLVLILMLVVSAFLCLACNTTGASNNFKRITQFTQEEINSMSDTDFFALLSSYDKTAILESLYTIDKKEYGRIISSSNSKEDAVQVCTRYFTDDRYEEFINTVIDCNVIYQSEILYGINVKWEVNNHIYEENVISFKKNIADITVENATYGDQESCKIYTNNEEQLKQILLYLHSGLHSLRGYVLDYEIVNNEKEFIMNVYEHWIVHGGYDMSDLHYLLKYSVKLDKVSGNVEFIQPVTIKRTNKES